MKRSFIFLILMWSSLFCRAQYSKEDTIYDYIDQYSEWAMKEMEKYGIPASITLAQAIYATDAGTNKICHEANNHFSIICHDNKWSGDIYYEDENRDANHCLRKYATAADSYRDHSLFIVQRSRYNKLFYLPITDYKSWARGLQMAGYSVESHYADTLIALIEKYYLFHYDRKVAAKMGDTVAMKAIPAPVTAKIEASMMPPEATKLSPSTSKTDTMEMNDIEVIVNKRKKEAQPDPNVENVTKPEPLQIKHIFTLKPSDVPFKRAYYPYTNRPVYENNKTKFILAKAGDTYKSIAGSVVLSEKNLRLYNDVYDYETELTEHEVVYLEMKSTKSPVEYHILEQGDNYRYIAQKYGIQLKLIIKRNGGALTDYKVGDKICIGCK